MPHINHIPASSLPPCQLYRPVSCSSHSLEFFPPFLHIAQLLFYSSVYHWTCRLIRSLWTWRTRANTGQNLRKWDGITYLRTNRRTDRRTHPTDRWTDRRTDQPTDWPTNGPTNQRTEPLIEVFCSTKKIYATYQISPMQVSWPPHKYNPISYTLLTEAKKYA